MPGSLARFHTVWQHHYVALIDDMTRTIQAQAGGEYPHLPWDEVRANTARQLVAWDTALAADDPTILQEVGYALGLNRATSAVPVTVFMSVFDIFRAAVWDLLMQTTDQMSWTMAELRQVEDWLHMQRTSVAQGYNERLHQVENELHIRADALQAQRDTIESLSTPLVPLFDGVVLVPLIGTIDVERAVRIAETVLMGITQRHAYVLIVDLTGISGMDFPVVREILRMVQAARLLGAETVIVGVNPEMAQSMIALDFPVADVMALADLQVAIDYALTRIGQRMVSRA